MIAFQQGYAAYPGPTDQVVQGPGLQAAAIRVAKVVGLGCWQ